jgi:tetratricopeptide (TPR) repeat protein
MDAMQHGHWPEAENLFGSAVKTCPASERARAGFAETLWQKDSRDEAIAQMEEAVRLSGGDPEMLVRLGEMHLAKGDLDSAELRAETAIKNQRHLASAWALRGDVQKSRGRLDEALLSYHRALSYQDHYPRVQVAISEVYRLQNRPLRALATLDHLSDRYAPGTIPSDVLFLRGLAQKALNRHDDAVESLAAAAKVGTPSADMLFQLSEAQLLAGDSVAARTTVMESLARHPQHLASQRLASRLQEEQQRVSVAGSSVLR